MEKDQFMSLLQSNALPNERLTWRGKRVSDIIKRLEETINENQVILCMQQIACEGRENALRALKTFCTKHNLEVSGIDDSNPLSFNGKTISNDFKHFIIVKFTQHK